MEGWGAFGPDACRSDPCAACAYWHLKVRALNGGRRELSDRELEFVGVVSHRRETSGVSRRRDASDGWRQPNTSPPPSAHVFALRALQDVGDPGRARLDFLGG